MEVQQDEKSPGNIYIRTGIFISQLTHHTIKSPHKHTDRNKYALIHSYTYKHPSHAQAHNTHTRTSILKAQSH